MSAVTPLELQGTVAERIATVRGDAEFALWAVQHGADWKTAWSTCPRPDWQLEAVLLTECREHGGAMHRRIVRWLVEEARVALVPCELLWARALDMAARFGRYDVPDWAVFPLIASFPSGVAKYDARTPPFGAGRWEAMANAALRTMSAAIDPASPVFAVRALARVLGGELENADLARRFAEAFECPQALRCNLPD